jgi:hypothetical protein
LLQDDEPEGISGIEDRIAIISSTIQDQRRMSRRDTRLRLPSLGHRSLGGLSVEASTGLRVRRRHGAVAFAPFLDYNVRNATAAFAESGGNDLLRG